MGQMVTNQFETLKMELDQCQWYLFERKFRKIYLTFLAFADQPTTIYGYGQIECIRTSLKAVITPVCTYKR